MIKLDGSRGEGGGQILRSSLALAALTGEKLLVTGVRAGRPNPGLRAQHLAAVKAMQRICGAKVRGATVGSSELLFEPGPARGGDYTLDVAAEARSAGSTSLVFQALLPALSFAGEPSHLVIRGGTHVAWSPPYHHLADAFLPALGRMGLRATLGLRRWGWYPVGQGEVEASVEPVEGGLSPLVLEGRFEPQDIRALSVSSRLPAHIAERQRNQLIKRLAERGLSATVDVLEAEAASPGSLVYLKATSGEGVVAVSALGERGKPAEVVADEAAGKFFEFLDGGGAVEEHLADQLVLYLALAGGESSFTTSRVSRHLLTNIWVIESFLSAPFGPLFEVEGELGTFGRIKVRGVGFAGRH